MRFEYLMDKFIDVECRISVDCGGKVVYVGYAGELPWYVYKEIKDLYISKLKGVSVEYCGEAKACIGIVLGGVDNEK